MLGRRQRGSALWGCRGRAPRHAASPPPPASVCTEPASLCQEPGLLGSAARPQAPARSVCFLSHFAKCLLIFSTETVPAKGSSHYSRKHFQLLAVTKNPTTNRKGHMNQQRQQVATLLPPGESCPTDGTWEQMPLFPLAQHSSNRLPQESAGV